MGERKGKCESCILCHGLLVMDNSNLVIWYYFTTGYFESGSWWWDSGILAKVSLSSLKYAHPFICNVLFF